MSRLLFFAALAALVYFAWRSIPSPLTPRHMSVDEAANLLGISPHSNMAEIKAAHRAAIKQAHPDAGGSAEAASRINLARDTLIAFAKRNA